MVVEPHIEGEDLIDGGDVDIFKVNIKEINKMKEVYPLELRLTVGKQVAVNNLGRKRNKYK